VPLGYRQTVSIRDRLRSLATGIQDLSLPLGKIATHLERGTTR
jgi:hypothetical protein